jgi:hypothetical protein
VIDASRPREERGSSSCVGSLTARSTTSPARAVASDGTGPKAIWHHSIKVADLARLDDFCERIPDAQLRERAQAMLNEGLRRRYVVAQLCCGNRLERFDGLLGLLVSELEKVAAGRVPRSGASGGGNSTERVA